MTVFEDRYVIRADTVQAQRATRDFQRATERTFVSANLKAMAYGKAVGFIASALRGAVGEFKKGISAAAEYERTNIALSTVAGSYTMILNEQSAALETVTNISDEVIRSMQTTAIATGVNKDEATEFIKAAVRMSNVTGKDVKSSFDQLIMTLGGSAAMIGRVIPDVKELTAEQLKAGGAVDLINEKFGDFLDLESKGLSGQVKTLGTQWDNLAEAIGKASTKWTTFNGIMSTFSATLGQMAQIIESPTGGLLEALETPFDQMAARAAQAVKDTRAAMIAELEASGTGGALEGGGLFTIGAPEIQGKGKTARGKRKKAAKKADFTVDTGEGGFLGGLPGARAYHEQLQEIEAEGQQILEDIRTEAADRYAGALQSTADRERAIKEASLDEQLTLEKEAAAEREEIQRKEAAARELIQKKAFDRIISITSSFAVASSQALISTIEGDEIAFKKMIKNFLKAQGSMLVGQGVRDAFSGLSRLYWGDLSGAGLAGLGAAEIGAGTAMIGGSLAVSLPGDSPSSAGAGLGAGGSGGGSGGGSAGVATGGERVINVYGAMTTAAQIELIRRGEEEAGRAGML